MDSLAGTEPEAPLGVRHFWRDGVPVLALDGELDLFTAGAFQERLAAAVEERPAALIVDLSGLAYIDSSGLGLLLNASRKIPGRLAVVTQRERIARLLQATGLAADLPLYRTIAEAVLALPAA
jgi:anti-sigma B factor antagonist